MNKRIILIVSIVVVLIALAVLKLKSNKENVEAKVYIHDSTAEVFVEASAPQTHEFESSLSFLGRTAAPVRRSFPAVYLKILRAPIRQTVAFTEDPSLEAA